jgi:ATP-dependent Clp protease protease subunit
MSQNTSYIIFSQGIDQNTVQVLMAQILNKIRAGAKSIVLLISSPGGQVTPGIALYNFLKGLPVEVITHSFGQADSMAVAVFCAGSKRYCTPDSRFLIHGIGFNPPPNIRFDERSLAERLEGLKNERETLSKIISENSNRSLKDVEKDMFKGVVWTPEQAVKNGLVHEIRQELFPAGSDVIKI